MGAHARARAARRVVRLPPVTRLASQGRRHDVSPRGPTVREVRANPVPAKTRGRPRVHGHCHHDLDVRPVRVNIMTSSGVCFNVMRPPRPLPPIHHLDRFLDGLRRFGFCQEYVDQAAALRLCPPDIRHQFSRTHIRSCRRCQLARASVELRGHLVCEANRRRLCSSRGHGAFDPFALDAGDRQTRDLVETCARRMTVDARTRRELVRFFCEEVLAGDNADHLRDVRARAS